MTLKQTLCALIAATTMSLNGCSIPINGGEVCEKYHESERKWVQVTNVPHTHHVGNLTWRTYSKDTLYFRDDEDFVAKIIRPKAWYRIYGDDTLTLYLDKSKFDSLKLSNNFVYDNTMIEDILEERKATKDDVKELGLIDLEEK